MAVESLGGRRQRIEQHRLAVEAPLDRTQARIEYRGEAIGEVGAGALHAEHRGKVAAQADARIFYEGGVHLRRLETVAGEFER